MAYQRLTVIAAVLAVVTILFSYLVAAIIVGPRGWDDGAITVAFARSLAAGHDFVLTLSSERVEGSSSLLYVFVLALLIPTDASAFPVPINIAQALSLVSLTGSLIVLFFVTKSSIPSVTPRLLAIGTFALLPMHLTEIINGMEMCLLGLLLLLFVLSERSRHPASYFLVPLILLVRFETVFYIGVALSFLWLFRREDRGRTMSLGVWLTVFFALLTLCRWYVFGDFLPNTIWAKMNPPYSQEMPAIQSLIDKFNGGYLFLRIHFPILIILACVYSLRPSSSRVADPAVGVLVGFFLFTLITGPLISGYPGRMFVGALPLLFLLVVEQLNVIRERETGSSVAIIASLIVISTILVNSESAKNNIKLILKAAIERELLPGPFERRVEQSLSEFRYSANSKTYRENGLAANEIAKALGVSKFVLNAPDIGGLGLCCPHGSLEVIDSALLANQRLAREGYSSFSQQLRETEPDLILTHWIWAKASGIYQDSYFLREYRPIVYRDTLFWIRADRRLSLLASERAKLSEVSEDWSLDLVRNDFRENDFTFFSAVNRYPIEILSLEGF